MSSLLAALALPAAKSAIESARGVAASAERSFADALRTAAEFCHGDADAKGVEEVEDGNEESDDLADRVAARLQEVLDGTGAESGEKFHLTFADDGGIEVTGESPSLSAVQTAINDDRELATDLWAWASEDGGSLDGDLRPSLTVEAA